MVWLWVFAALCTGDATAVPTRQRAQVLLCELEAVIAASAGDRQWRFAQTLAGHLASLGPTAVPVIVEHLASESLSPLCGPWQHSADHPMSRSYAADALSLMDPDTTIPLLVQAYDDVPAARPGILDALSRFREQAAPAVPIMRRGLTDKAADTRAAAVEALAQVGEAASGALAELIAALDDSTLRIRAAYALAHIGMPASTRACPALAKHKDAGEHDGGMRWAITNAWEALGCK